jgi:hypothetical protein
LTSLTSDALQKLKMYSPLGRVDWFYKKSFLIKIKMKIKMKNPSIQLRETGFFDFHFYFDFDFKGNK